MTAPDPRRARMLADDIVARGVADPRVLAAMAAVPRERFVPPEHADLAYADRPLPIGDGQTISQPYVVAWMVEALELRPDDRVLEIGTGSGYLAALMARQCASVVSLEIDPALAQQARANLQAAGVKNVDVRTADATADQFAACNAGAPFDAIVLSGSVAEVPQELLALLKTGGRLWAVVGRAPAMRATLVRAVAGGQHVEQPWDVSAPRLQHFPESSPFKF